MATARGEGQAGGEHDLRGHPFEAGGLSAVAVESAGGQPIEPSAPVGVRRCSLARPAALGFLAATAVVAGATLGGRQFVSHLPGAWFFGAPGGPLGSLSAGGRHAPTLDVLLVYGGLIVLAGTWVSTCRTLGRAAGTDLRRVVVLVAIWSVPFLLGPPLFSRDLFSYAGQGEMVSHHIDPYLYGTGVLGYTRFNVLAGPLWANTPSPYGPTFLWLDGLVADLARHQALPDLVMLRALAVAGVLLIMAGLPTLARAAGRDPAQSLVVGAGSPLVLTTLIGGAHNDALMLGLLVAGLAVARRVGPVPGIVLCALAAGVKAPALLGVVFLGWHWPGRRASARRRVATSAAALAIAGVTLGVLSALTGIGWGWVRTVTAPDKILTGVTPVDALSKVLTGAAHLAHLPLTLAEVRTVTGLLALALAGAVGLWLLVRSPRRGVTECLGLALLVLALSSPVLWAWYLTWGLVLLSPVATGVLRRLLAPAVVAGTLVGVTSVRGMAETVLRAGLPRDALLVVGLSAALMLGLRLAQRDRAGAVAGDPADDGGRPPGPGATAGAGGDRLVPDRYRDELAGELTPAFLRSAGSELRRPAGN